MAELLEVAWKKLKANPSNLKLYLDFIAYCLAQGDNQSILQALNLADQNLPKKARLPRQFYAPVMKSFKGQGLWQLLDYIGRQMMTHYGEYVHDTEDLKRLIRSCYKQVNLMCPIGPIYPEKVKGELWWSGPITAPESYQGEDLLGAYPAHLTLKDSKVYMRTFDVDEGPYITCQQWELELDTLGESGIHLKEHENLHCEVGIYSPDTVRIFPWH